MEILTEAAGEQNPYLSTAYQHTQFYLPFCLLSLGEWGEALREVNVSIATADRNGDYFRAQLLCLNRAWIHLHAMDFAGVLTACEATPKGTGNFGVGSVYLFRFSRVLTGLAEVALGNYDQAFKELLTLRKDMDRKTFMLDWYFRMPLESALTELWLAIGSLTKAREGANLFLGKAMSTMERTWQALAWELNARVAMAERNLGGAQEAILKALSVIEGRETPLAAWRVSRKRRAFLRVFREPEIESTSSRNRQNDSSEVGKFFRSRAFSENVVSLLTLCLWTAGRKGHNLYRVIPVIPLQSSRRTAIHSLVNALILLRDILSVDSVYVRRCSKSESHTFSRTTPE